MRVVQLLENLETGGLERMAVDLCLAQRKAGHDVAVYCLFGKGPLAKVLEEAQVPVTAFEKPPGFSLATVWSMARQLRRDRADVLHGHNPGVHHYGALAARLAGVPVCVNTRHSAFTSDGLAYQERYFRMVEPLTHHVVFVCDHVRQLLEPALRYPEAKCSVIHNGIPLQRFLAHPVAPGARLPGLRFGTVGRLVPAKGHSIMIDAFARAAAEMPGAELSLYGYGILESQLAAQISQLGMEGRIRLEGRTDDAAGVLAGLDVFIFSSLNEGLPLVILEAMAAGLPVISTRVGGIAEVLPDRCAWLCPPGDVGALAAALLEAARCRDLERLGQEARKIATAHYSIDQMEQEYHNLYKGMRVRPARVEVL